MATSVPAGAAGFSQAQPVVYYSGIPSGQPQAVIHIVNDPPSPASNELRLRKSHKILGIIQMVVGSICFVAEVIGLIVGPRSYLTGVGIYVGIFFFLPGLFGYLAARKNSKCLIVACMVMNIIATIMAYIGISLSVVEIQSLSYYSYRRIKYQRAKEAINVSACVFEFVVTIVHASFTCASCCPCCVQKSRQRVVYPATMVIQQPGQLIALNAAGMQATPHPGTNLAFGGGQEASPLPNKSRSGLVDGEEAAGHGAFRHGATPPPSYLETEQGRF